MDVRVLLYFFQQKKVKRIPLFFILFLGVFETKFIEIFLKGRGAQIPNAPISEVCAHVSK